jgi:DHA1 family bicyclomycin/chloramphenicol resistance-like MFS transporter
LKLRPGSFALTALLALFTTIGPLSIDLYIPGLPEIARSLAAPDAEVQLTISIYIVGFAGGQVLYGPLSDRYGRRPVLIAALALFCVATLMCAAAPSIASLLAARFVQGFGASGAIVLARAVIRDLYEGAGAARELSRMAMIMGLAPIVAPLIGAGLQTVSGWRADFVFMFAAGIVGVTLAVALLPETRRASASAPQSFADVLASFAVIARHRGFLIHITLVSLSFAGLFAWISGSSFVLQNLYGLSPQSYGVAFATSACGFIVGTSIAANLVGRIGVDRTIGIGAAALAAAGVALIGSALFLPRSGPSLAIPMALYLAGLGFVMPPSFAAALQPFPERAGAASALGGVIQQSAAAIMGAAVGHALGTTAWPLVLSLAVAAWLTLAVWFFSRGLRGTNSA